MAQKINPYGFQQGLAASLLMPEEQELGPIPLMPQAQLPIPLQAQPEQKPEQLTPNMVSGGSVKTANKYVGDPRYKDLIASRNALIDESFGQQESGIKDLESYLGKLKAQETGFDMSPLAAYVDSWTGSNLQKGYTKPLTQADKDASIVKMQDYIQKAKQGLTDDQINQLKTLMSDRSNEQMLLAMGRNGRFDESQLLKKEEIIRKDLEKEVFEPMFQYQQDVGNMEDLINEGSIASVQTALSNYAKYVGGQKGVLTDKDIAMVYPKALEDAVVRAQAWVESNPNTPLPPALLKPLKDGINISRKNAEQVFAGKIDNKKRVYSGMGSMKDLMLEGQGGYNMFQEANRMIGGFKGGPKSQSPQVPKDLQQMLLEEKQRRQKGK